MAQVLLGLKRSQRIEMSPTARHPLVTAFFLALACGQALAGNESRPVSFSNHVMAAISKAGCNLGTCHGNATGKGGFKLSLRGQDDPWDYAAMVLDAQGRRVNPFVPENSLLLLKGTNKIAHEGGKRFDPKSWEYGVLRDWLMQGMPGPSKNEAHLTKLEVAPREAALDAKTDQVQLTAKATFSDGTVLDVTPEAVYEPLQNDLVEVSREGLVKRLQFGEPSVLVRYLTQSIPVRLMFVPDRPGFEWAKGRRFNYIDTQVFNKLKALNMNASGLCTDSVFARRAYLDLLGIPPTADEARGFVADKRPAKRERLVNELLARPEFADFWAMKWADVLKVESRTLDTTGMKAFHGWIRDAIRTNRPLDAFVRDIIATTGSSYTAPPTNFYRANRTPVERSVSAAQVFLGTRLQCAQCHNHPFDKWTQDDYYNWAAVFARVDYKLISDKRTDKNDKHEFIGEQVIFLQPKAEVDNPRTGDPAKQRLLGADLPALKEGEDELQAAAKWLTSGANPLFAKAQANRIWFYIMGRGLVDPVDDFRLTNPASHPVLLDMLAKDLVESGFDMKHLVRTIMLSRTYQLESTPNETNKDDTINYSHNQPRRLSAEQLFDSLYQAFGVVPDLDGVPAGYRASQKPGPINGKSVAKANPGSPEAFLAQFGKPARQLSCECERASTTSLSQTFQLISGPIVTNVITDKYNVLRGLSKSSMPPEKMAEELVWRTLGRAPAEEERQRMTRMIQAASDKREALEDLAWSLANAKEFVLRQ